MDKTIEYYNQNADMFAQGTRLVDFTIVQERLRKMLPVGSRILDFGCGSGRDPKYFLEKGYQVAATDGSSELCKLASAFTGIEVKEAEDARLYERNINEGDKVCFDVNNKLEKVE